MDRDTGTGAVKITPAYSRVDWEMCQRNNVLDFIECIDAQGRFTTEGFQGDDRAKATEKIKSKLENLGLYRWDLH